MRFQIRTAIAIGIFIVSSIVVVNTLLVNNPVVIQIEGDAFKIVDIPYRYTTNEAYVLLVSAFLCGFSLSLIILDFEILQTGFQKTGVAENLTLVPDQEPQSRDASGVVLKALSGDEKETVKFIVNNGGRILQNELVNSLNFSKAKVSRILINLEKRGIITKRKYGLTNCISLSDDIRGETK
jgi:uncharacterized membrane protein